MVSLTRFLNLILTLQWEISPAYQPANKTKALFVSCLPNWETKAQEDSVRSAKPTELGKTRYQDIKICI